MTGEINILMISTILIVFHLTNTQPSTLKLIWATANEHCRTRNESLLSLNNLNSSGSSSTDLPIRRIWLSVDRKYTPWIAFKGCFEIKMLPPGLIQNDYHIVENTVEGCYLECQKENISCGQNEPIHFVRKRSLCFCVCKIQEFLSHSYKCNNVCSSSSECNTDNVFSVYTEYVSGNTKPDGFCLLCSKTDLNSNLMTSAFGCDEPIGLCAEREDICYGIKENNCNLNYSMLNCIQQLPFYCLKDNGTEKSHVRALFRNNDFVFIIASSGTVIAMSVLVLCLLHRRVLRRRRHVHAKLHEKHEEYDNLTIHLEESRPGQSTSNDPNIQKVYHIIVPITRNNGSQEANHYYDHILRSGQEDEYHYEKVL